MASLKSLVQRILGVTGSIHKIEFAVDDTGEKEVWGFKKDDSTEVTPFTDDIKIKSGLAQDVDGMFIPANSSTSYHSIEFGVDESTPSKPVWGYKKDGNSSVTPFADNDLLLKIFEDATIESMYPVGSIYVTTASDIPSILKNKQVDGTSRGWTWSKVADGRSLQGCTSGATGTVAAGLPNIKGDISSGKVVICGPSSSTSPSGSGAISLSGSLNKKAQGNRDNFWWGQFKMYFKASGSNSIYKDSVSTVQPPAYKVYVFRRTA